MEPHLRAAVAKIEVRHDGAVTSRGTGTLVAHGLVLTALHVVGDRKSDPTVFYPGEIHLTFPDGTTTAVPVDGKWDRQLDWALLRCTEPPDIIPAPLGDLHHGGVDWTTYGFPDAQPIDGMVQAGQVRNVDARLGGQPAYQLFSEDAAAGNGAPVKGLSGGPVFVDGALVGVLRFALMKEGQAVAGTLYACPVHAPVEVCAGALPIPDPCSGLPGLPRKPLPELPFRFLARYDADDAEIFFGRNRQIRQLFDLITDPGTADVILLYGQTGVGKSSFLDAGLVPRLQWRYGVRYLRREMGSTLLETVRRTLREEAGGADPGTHASLQDLWHAAESNTGRPLAVLLDQVEEVYTRSGTDGDREILELGAALARAFGAENGPRGRLILSFRKEWYPEIQKRLEERGVDFARVFLESLDAEGICEAVSGLASTARLRARYGLTVAEELPALVAAQLQEDRDSPVAPTLQILLTKMWEEATAISRHAPDFTPDLYWTLKQEGVLLGDFLDQQIEALSTRHPPAVASGLVLDVLAQHTTPLLTADECSVRALVTQYGHQEGFAQLLADMQDLYILVDAGRDRGSGDAVTRLTHDTLAPHVRRLFDESMLPGQAAARIIHSRVNEDDDPSDMAPLGPRTLAVVEQGLGGMRALRPAEQRLVAMSREARDRAAALRRNVQGGFVVLLVFLAMLTTFAFEQKHEAERDRLQTDLSNTTDKVRSDLNTSPVVGLLVAFNAANKALREGFPLANELQMSLSDAVERAREKNQIHVKFPVNGVSVHPAGHTFAVALADGHIRLFDVLGKETKPALPCFDEECADDESPAALRHSAAVAVAYADGGETLYAAGADGRLRRFAPITPNQPPHVRDHGNPLSCLAVSDDGELVATGAEDGSIVVWRKGDDQPYPIDVPENAGCRANAVTFLPDSHVLVSAHDSGRVRRWEIAAQGAATLLLPVIDEKQGPVLCLAAARAPSGEVHLATGGQDRTVRVYLADGSPLWRPNRPRDELSPAEAEANERRVVIDAHHAPVVSVCFDESGDTIFSGGANGIVRVHEHRGPAAARPFRGLDGAATALAYAGAKLTVIGSADGRVRIRDSRGLQREHDLRALNEKKFEPSDPGIRGVAINHDGSRLATTADRGYATIWRSADFLELQELPMDGCRADLRDAIFVVPGGPRRDERDPSDREMLVSGCSKGHLHAWGRDLARTDLSISTQEVTCLDVDPSSRWLAVGAADGIVKLIDLEDLADPKTPDAHSVYDLTRDPDGPLARARVTDVAIGPRARVPGGLLAVALDDSALGARDGEVEIWERSSTWRRKQYEFKPSVSGKPKDHRFFSRSDSHGVIYSLAMRPDGSTLFSVGQDGKIRGRSLTDGRERFAAQKAHLGGAYAIDISSDGARVMTGGNDGRVVLWGIVDDEVETPKRIVESDVRFHFGRIAEMVPNHAAPVAAVAFGGPDELYTMSGGEAGSARVWRSHPLLWLEIAAQRLRHHPDMAPVPGRYPKVEAHRFIDKGAWWEQLGISRGRELR